MLVRGDTQTSLWREREREREDSSWGEANFAFICGCNQISVPCPLPLVSGCRDGAQWRDPPCRFYVIRWDTVIVQEVWMAPRVIEMSSQSSWGSPEPSTPVSLGNSEGTWIQRQSSISAPLEIMSGSEFERQELLSHAVIHVNDCSWHPSSLTLVSLSFSLGKESNWGAVTIIAWWDESLLSDYVVDQRDWLSYCRCHSLTVHTAVFAQDLSYNT
jgi:hypothetical protein